MEALSATSLSAHGSPTTRRMLWATFVMALLFSLWFAFYYQDPTDAELSTVGAVTFVTEASTGLVMEARVDTGAATCSLHCEQIVILDAADDPSENVGKSVRCLMKNNLGATAWLKATIVDYQGVRTTSELENRYFVKILLRTADIEDTVRVSLNDRTDMTYPFLLGRNLLRDSFLVDVSEDRTLDEMK